MEHKKRKQAKRNVYAGDEEGDPECIESETFYICSCGAWVKVRDWDAHRRGEDAARNERARGN